MTTEERELLIWGTTYPEFSKTYYETVCTGAVDVSTGEMIRIYPIRLRLMRRGDVEDGGDAFRKWNVIRATLSRPRSGDSRPESRRIDESSIRLVREIDTRDFWRERRELVMRPGAVFPSVEALHAAQLDRKTSFGLVKPARVTRVRAVLKGDGELADWNRDRAAALAQRDLFLDDEIVLSAVDVLQFIEVEYRVEFECANSACNGHDMSIRDWEILELHRNETRRELAGKRRPDGRIVVATEGVIDKLNEFFDRERHDTWLFLGNTAAHPQNFMVVGLFYPLLKRQQSLF